MKKRSIYVLLCLSLCCNIGLVAYILKQKQFNQVLYGTFQCHDYLHETLKTLAFERDGTFVEYDTAQSREDFVTGRYEKYEHFQSSDAFYQLTYDDGKVVLTKMIHGNLLYYAEVDGKMFISDFVQVEKTPIYFGDIQKEQ